MLEQSQVLPRRGQEVRKGGVFLEVAGHTEGEEDLSQPESREECKEKGKR